MSNVALEIVWDDDIPDTTYFRLSDVSPQLEKNVLTIYDGEGSRRSWGRPAVWSTVVVESSDLVAVHVGFRHKHRGGQGWFYYCPSPETGEWTRVTWAQLSDDDRERVLAAYQERAPQWAKEPGRLRRATLSARENGFVALKVLALDEEGRLHSLYDPKFTYELGKTYREKAQPYHWGGFYAHLAPTAEELIQEFLGGGVYQKPDDGEYALIEGEFWGRKVFYTRGGHTILGNPAWWDDVKKIATTYFRPKRVLVRFRVEEGQVVWQEAVSSPLEKYPASIET